MIGMAASSVSIASLLLFVVVGPNPPEGLDAQGCSHLVITETYIMMTARSSIRCSPFWGLGLTDRRRRLTQIQLIERGDVALWGGRSVWGVEVREGFMWWA